MKSQTLQDYSKVRHESKSRILLELIAQFEKSDSEIQMIEQSKNKSVQQIERRFYRSETNKNYRFPRAFVEQSPNFLTSTSSSSSLSEEMALPQKLQNNFFKDNVVADKDLQKSPSIKTFHQKTQQTFNHEYMVDNGGSVKSGRTTQRNFQINQYPFESNLQQNVSSGSRIQTKTSQANQSQSSRFQTLQDLPEKSTGSNFRGLVPAEGTGYYLRPAIGKLNQTQKSSSPAIQSQSRSIINQLKRAQEILKNSHQILLLSKSNHQPLKLIDKESEKKQEPCISNDKNQNLLAKICNSNQGESAKEKERALRQSIQNMYKQNYLSSKVNGSEYNRRLNTNNTVQSSESLKRVNVCIKSNKSIEKETQVFLFQLLIIILSLLRGILQMLLNKGLRKRQGYQNKRQITLYSKVIQLEVWKDRERNHNKDFKIIFLKNQILMYQNLVFLRKIVKVSKCKTVEVLK